MPHPWFTWRDLLVVLVHAPDDAPLKRALAGCGHSPAEHLTLLLHYTLSAANWQRAGGKRHERPKPLDCMLPPDLRETQVIGTARMTLEETADFLGWEIPPPT